MIGSKRKIFKNLLLSSGLVIGNLSNAYAMQVNLPVTMATNASLAIKQNPNPSFLLAMANNLHTSIYAKQNKELVIYLLKTAAKQGNAEAQFQLGSLYMNSELLNQNEDKALYWLTQAADQNHAHAQFLYEQIMGNGYDIGC